MNHRYAAIFTPEEVGGYSVVVPDLPGCFSQGDTLYEAAINAAEAIALNIEYYLASSKQIPVPSSQVTASKGDLVIPVTAVVDHEQVSVGAPYMTTAEAGELLGVSDSRVRQLCGDGSLEWKKPGRDLQVARWSVDEYRRTHASRSPAVLVQN